MKLFYIFNQSYLIQLNVSKSRYIKDPKDGYLLKTNLKQEIYSQQ